MHAEQTTAALAPTATAALAPTATAEDTLAGRGRARIDWAEASMPVLATVRGRFAATKPLAGARIAACLHVTAETAVLARTLVAGGADLRLCASNPLSTQDDVVASLLEHEGIAVFAQRGVDRDGYYAHIRAALAHRPTITIDDGADLVRLLHTERVDLLEDVIGGTEETTTGVVRLRAMARAGVLRYPVVAVNDALTKHHIDNRYGTGQSTIDALLRATNHLLAGQVFVVCGYGWCGRGIAARAKGMGARVIVTEVDALRALEATLDGFAVMPMAEAAPIGDFFCTATGNRTVIETGHMQAMKDGAVLCNAGHFDVEIDMAGLEAMAIGRTRVRPEVDAWQLAGGPTLHVVGEGRLVNLAGAEGHPPAVMDLSFANQALVAEHLMLDHALMAPGVIAVPEAIDRRVARLKLEAMGVAIDRLTERQREYMAAWQEGT